MFCLLIIPFSYFWYEEWDEESTLGSRVRGALKYSVLFLVITVALLLTGFFIPLRKDLPDRVDLDYLKHLLSENRTHTSYPINNRRRKSALLRSGRFTLPRHDILRCLHSARIRSLPHKPNQTNPHNPNQRHRHRPPSPRPKPRSPTTNRSPLPRNRPTNVC